MDRKGCLFVFGIVFAPFGLVLGAGIVMSVREWRKKESVLTPAHRAFFTAARRGDVDGLRAGLQQGVGVDEKEPFNQRTALMRAAGFNHSEAVEFLLASRANPNLVDQDARTAVHIAAQTGAVDVVPLLREAGADLNVLCPDLASQRTPVGVAVRVGDVEMVRALLSAGADPERARPNGESPLEDAIDRRQPDLVRALISGGAQLTPSRGGSSPSLLHRAIQNCRDGASEVVKALVEAKADTTTRDPRGLTPLEALEQLDPRVADVDCFRPMLDALRAAQ